MASTSTAKSAAPAAAPERGKILFIFTSNSRMGTSPLPGGYYLPEAAHPYQVFSSAGLYIDFASPEGGAVPVDPSSLTELAKDPVSRDFHSSDEVKGKLNTTYRIADVDFNYYDCVFFVGGHAPMWDLPNNHALVNKLAQFYKDGGIIAAVCHGPCALINVSIDGKMLLEGKEVTGFSNAEEDKMKMSSVVPFLLESKLKDRGARYKCASPFDPCVVVSDRLITGQNPASAKPLGETVLKIVRERIAARPAHVIPGAAERIASGPKLQPNRASQQSAMAANVPGNA